MAYLRYSKDCEWHVYEEVKTGESENRLAVGTKITRLKVCRILRA